MPAKYIVTVSLTVESTDENEAYRVIRNLLDDAGYENAHVLKVRPEEEP